MLERCYKYLDNIFGQKFNNYTNGPCFWQKQMMWWIYSISHFSEETRGIRALISTIIFGMGVNCKGLRHKFWTIFVDYFQEAGGAGRDGLQSESHLII